MSTTPNRVIDRIEKPYYYHHYPVFKRVKLPAVKHGIYNPHLPTLRHMDRDTVGRTSSVKTKPLSYSFVRMYSRRFLNK